MTSKSKAPTQAKAFVDYALSKPAQEVFAELGLPPGAPAVLAEHQSKFPTPSGLFTIRDIGGWEDQRRPLRPGQRRVAKIEQSAGVSTDK